MVEIVVDIKVVQSCIDLISTLVTHHSIVSILEIYAYIAQIRRFLHAAQNETGQILRFSVDEVDHLRVRVKRSQFGTN